MEFRDSSQLQDQDSKAFWSWGRSTGITKCHYICLHRCTPFFLSCTHNSYHILKWPSSRHIVCLWDFFCNDKIHCPIFCIDPPHAAKSRWPYPRTIVWNIWQCLNHQKQRSSLLLWYISVYSSVSFFLLKTPLLTTHILHLSAGASLDLFFLPW